MTAEAEEAQDAPTPEPENEKFSIKAAADDLRELFETLQPPDRIRLKDGFGGAYIVPAMIVGSAQLRINRRLGELGTLVDVDAVRKGGPQAIADTILQLAASEEILDALSDAFEEAHPAVMQAAKRRAETFIAQQSEMVDEGDGEYELVTVIMAEVPERAKDLFPAEELIAGILPFYLRFVVRLFGVLLAAMEPKES
jgi:hypothetical protein